MKKITFTFAALPLLCASLLLGCKKDDDGYHKDAGEPNIVVKANDVSAAFPGAEGYGQKISGGRGGHLYKVTNLNDAGEGSLREAVEAKGPRIIMFNVSGTITLNSRLKISNDSVTIAGQTAPGDGITLRKFPVVVAANNVVLRYLRFRMGDETGMDADAISGVDKKNIIIDHCSISWSTDAAATFYNNENFTLGWSIIAESLHNPGSANGAHGYAGIWGGKNATFHHNLIANNDSRNPRFGERAGTSFAATDLVDFRNNVIYNWGSNSASGGEGMNINIVNNYYKPGPATPVAIAERIFAADKNLSSGTVGYNKWGKYYILGNVVEGYANPTADNWANGVFNQFSTVYGIVPDTAKTAMKATTAFATGNVTTHDAATAFDRVLSYAGASLKRDEVDARIIDHTRTGNSTAGSNNGLIGSQSVIGGWPTLQSTSAPVDSDGDGMPDDWETSRGLDPQYANARARNLSNIYDNLEVYLNSLVQTITENQVK